MSIVIVFNNKDPKPWAEKLKSKLSDIPIQIYPEIHDPSIVKFALCWKPNQNILLQFPNLKVVQSVGASVEHIIKTQELRKTITLSRIVDNNLSHDMWEYLLTAILSISKNNFIYAHQQSIKLWKQHPYTNIQNTNISILGLGKIGSFVAEKLGLLGYKVKGWSSSVKNINNVISYSGIQELDKCLHNTDILINILPLTDTTQNILNITNLKKINAGGYLINVGRGEHLVENDLLDLLEEKYLSGAILDVFRSEPLPDNHPFWNHPKIQITPHVASLTNIESASLQIVENYNRFTSGKELMHEVSLKKGY
ncbi:2-hydroxyacid dehydrogenase [Aquimarina algiphila]|uniref:2-hydroxyacid dehydrogenase n=1 Tax=Aquimarina algiphila TaxID=2047982 RepID=UPI00232B1371|nr:glyoxylate/hydroxypyruvate reductase A [Aquimarina algiphila]